MNVARLQACEKQPFDERNVAELISEESPMHPLDKISFSLDL